MPPVAGAHLLVSLAAALGAHPGDVHAPEPVRLALAGVLPLLLVATAALYALGLRRQPAQARWRWPTLGFALGWLALAVALAGPVDEGAERLLWVHMTQHELLMLVAAPLLVLGRPIDVWLWALPLAWRRRLVRGSRRTGISRAWRMLTLPAVAWSLHALALWGWHAPAAYEAAVRDEAVHFAQHACFLGSAVLFWWSLAHGRHGRLGYGAGVLYVFTTGMHGGLLGALMTFSSRTWYPIYEAREVAAGWQPLQDQQVAGLLMWVPAGLLFLVVGLALFAAWIGEAERRVALGRSDGLLRAAGAGERP